MSMIYDLKICFFRFAASGCLSPAMFRESLPAASEIGARSAPLSLEIVSHCWQYSHLLVYQLSSLVLFNPKNLKVTMTVFYCPEDQDTVAMLDYFAALRIDNIRWNWQPLPKAELFRRSIGRNRAAKATICDWVWFTDCDLMFRDGCLDRLSEALQGRQDMLVFPAVENTTGLLAEDHSVLGVGKSAPRVIDIDETLFKPKTRKKAKGPLQITHGDVCRAVGYCDSIAVFQQPVASGHFAKCHEDRVFRWLLGSNGVPLELPGVYRIRHQAKGRYAETGFWRTWRKNIRVFQSRIRGD